LLVVRITIIWQRKSFNFIYGFAGEGLKLGDPMYEILAAYPQMDKYYGVLSGMAYSVPMSVCGLALGMLKGGFNRTFLMSAALCMAGATQILSGSVNSLACLAAMRVMHGAFNSIT
jgi:sugar phosphate permease